MVIYGLYVLYVYINEMKVTLEAFRARLYYTGGVGHFISLYP